MPGWSGTPLFREDASENFKVTGLHIAGAPKGIDSNIEVAAPMIARLWSDQYGLEKDFLNCPLSSPGNLFFDEDRWVEPIEFGEEKSTNAKVREVEMEEPKASRPLP